MKRVWLKPEQIEYLLENLEHLDALVDGRALPQNAAVERFVQVAQGKGKPTTEYEKAYFTFKKQNYTLSDLKRQREKNQAKLSNEKTEINLQKQTVTLKSKLALSEQASLTNRKRNKQAKEINGTSTKKVVDKQSIPASGTLKRETFTHRKMAEPLGTRDDYKKDKASWRR